MPKPKATAMVPAMAQAGIRYFSTSPNFFDRIGTAQVASADQPFWWVGPSGRERLLTWNSWMGYALSMPWNAKLTPAHVAEYIDPPQLDYKAMKAEADRYDPTYFTTSTAAYNYLRTKIVTETQLLRLLGNSALQVDITLLHMDGHLSKNTSQEHLMQHYDSFDDVAGEKFDAAELRK